MIPKPVYAVLLLFPVTKAYEEERRAQAARLREESEKGGREGEEERLRDLVYFKQTVSFEEVLRRGWYDFDLFGS